MNPINTYKDMQPFSGFVVAYQTKSCSFSDSFSFDDEPEVKFGTVSHTTSRFRGIGDAEDRTGFTLIEFLKPKSVIIHHGLTKSELERQSLAMRAASPAEIDKLQSAVDLGKASHCHGLDWDTLKDLAQKHFATIEPLKNVPCSPTVQKIVDTLQGDEKIEEQSFSMH